MQSCLFLQGASPGTPFEKFPTTARRPSMTTKNATSDTCPSCGKGWNTHHTLASVIGDKAHIQCHADGIPDTAEYRLRSELLIVYLNARAGRKAAEAKLLEVRQQAELDKQASEAELKRKFESKVETEANKKVAEVVAEIDADHKKALDD